MKHTVWIGGCRRSADVIICVYIHVSPRICETVTQLKSKTGPSSHMDAKELLLFCFEAAACPFTPPVLFLLAARILAHLEYE